MCNPGERMRDVEHLPEAAFCHGNDEHEEKSRKDVK